MSELQILETNYTNLMDAVKDLKNWLKEVKDICTDIKINYLTKDEADKRYAVKWAEYVIFGIAWISLASVMYAILWKIGLGS